MSLVKNLDLSIIILSYKSLEHLKVLLPSVWESEGVEFRNNKDNNYDNYASEVIIVDNGSGDGTVEWLKELISKSVNQQISLFENQNTGFAHGNNIGIRKSKGKYILLLNPDTKLEKNTLQEMLNFMERRLDVGMAGCKLVKANGKLDLACRRRFPNPWNSFKRLFLFSNTDYNYSNLSEDTEMEVDSIVGAFLLTRSSLIEKIGLLDDSFFMYGEDLDWCWRCKQAGFKVWYFPKVKCLHFKGESSKKVSAKALLWFHEAMWIFYKKHYFKNYPQILNLLVFVGIWFRYIVLRWLNFLKSK